MINCGCSTKYAFETSFFSQRIFLRSFFFCFRLFLSHRFHSFRIFRHWFLRSTTSQFVYFFLSIPPTTVTTCFELFVEQNVINFSSHVSVIYRFDSIFKTCENILFEQHKENTFDIIKSLRYISIDGYNFSFTRESNLTRFRLYTLKEHYPLSKYHFWASINFHLCRNHVGYFTHSF